MNVFLKNHQNTLSSRTLVAFVLPQTLYPHETKFDTRAYKCIFNGYTPGFKAHKLYDLNTHKTLISRDVIFYESIFPFQPINQDNSYCPLPNVDINADAENDLSALLETYYIYILITRILMIIILIHILQLKAMLVQVLLFLILFIILNHITNQILSLYHMFLIL